MLKTFLAIIIIFAKSGQYTVKLVISLHGSNGVKGNLNLSCLLSPVNFGVARVTEMLWKDVLILTGAVLYCN